MTNRSIRNPVFRNEEDLRRVGTFGEFVRASEDSEEPSREVEISFSSESEEIVRWMFIDGDYAQGREVLDHSKKSVDLRFMSSGTAPFLMDHNTRDQRGVIKSAKLENKRGKAVVQFSRNPLGEELRKDVEDGIRTNISVGYTVHRMEVEYPDDPDELPIFRAVSWAPHEASSVSIPADVSVGVGRSKPEITVKETRNMTIEATEKVREEEPKLSPDEVARIRKELQENEAERVKSILELAARWNIRDVGDVAIEAGHTIERFRGSIIDHIPQGKDLYAPVSEIGMTKKDVRNFSFYRLIHAIKPDATDNDKEAASFELEAAEAANDNIRSAGGQPPNGYYLPIEMQREMQRQHFVRNVRTVLKSAEPELVATEHLANEFINYLYASAEVIGLGARVMTGLVGDLEIPKLSSPGATGWLVAEHDQAPASDITTTQVAMSPKDIATTTALSRRLMKQSQPAAEGIIQESIAIKMGLGIDLAAINGTGAAGQPTGVLNAAGVNVIDHGVNGGLPTWALTIAFIRDVMNANVPGSGAWLTNALVWATMATTEKATNTANFILDVGSSSLAGRPYASSSQMPANGTKGTGTNLSSAIYGVWPNMMIGFWGVLDILVDKYTDANRGGLNVHAFQTVDVALRHAEAFSRAEDIITT